MNDGLSLTNDEIIERTAKINRVFTPSAPINTRSLFAGRIRQIQDVISATSSRGQHAILYGERGVGKTSLASIIHDLMVLAHGETTVVAKYTCGASSSFDGMWRSLLSQIAVSRNGKTATLDMVLPKPFGSEDVRHALTQADNPLVLVIDELDTITDANTIRVLADTVKTLSDHSVNATLILVGVADSVDGLIAEHQSIERALLQVQMPRMSRPELTEIIDKGLDPTQADMSIDSHVKEDIASLSQGLPNYTHLLAKYAALSALASRRRHINASDLESAIRDAVAKQQQTIKSAYHSATSSPRKNLYKEVLLACALVPIDELGYFNAGALREPMKRITGADYDIPAFSKHLNDFCSDARGSVLEKKGQTRRFRFRFRNPMMQPYVLLKGVSDNLITQEQISTPGSNAVRFAPSPTVEPE